MDLKVLPTRKLRLLVRTLSKYLNVYNQYKLSEDSETDWIWGSLYPCLR